MKYLSVCSGIEAASVAWEPLGFTPIGFSEIEKFPCSVLEHHYPGVPNFGDMTNHKEWGIEPGSVDILVGGTPCQSFSVAGLRGGLTDDRGNLALTYCRILQRLKPRWFVWENVPGVLSSNRGRDFGSILGAMAELGYGLSYRVLDAQFFGVPQRRRRVFVVGCLGDWRRAAEVLFEPGCVSGDSQKGRKAKSAVAALTSSGVGTCGADDNQGQAGHLIAAYQCHGSNVGPMGTIRSGNGNESGGVPFLATSTGHTSHCLNAGGMGRIDYETETMVAHALRGEGFDASEDGTGRGTPLVPVAFNHQSGGDFRPQPSWDLANALQRSQGQAVAFSAKDYGGDAMEGVSPTLRAGGHAGSHANAGVMPAVAFDLRGREGGAMPEGPHDTANIRAASGGSSRSYIAQPWAVRRLTPTECERLQGFPDDFTRIPYRGKPADKCPDGPRYKALGNSMAVNVMRWIGERIQMNT